MKGNTSKSQIEALEESFLQDFQLALDAVSDVVCGDVGCTQKKGNEYARFFLISQLIYIFDPDPPNIVRDFLETKHLGIKFDEKRINLVISDFFLHYSYTNKEYLYTDAVSQVDPSILGRIYERHLTGEERERKGIFFTSKIEIELMCKIALLNYLKTRTTIPSQKLVKFLFDPTLRKLGERDCQEQCPLDRSEALEISNLLDNLRILDPACGSGAFLLGICHEVYYLRHILSRSFTGMPPESASIISTFKMLYGVDVNPLALWMTKIRLWISLVDFVDFDQKKHSKEIGQLLETHFIQGDYLVNFDAFPDQMFDIVIGNPPYVQYTRISPPTIQSPTKEQKAVYLNEIQINAQQYWKDRINFHGQVDYYVYFFLRGLMSLKIDGILCFITSSTWLDGELGISLREFLLKYTLIVELLDTIVHKSFTQANINTVITVLQKISRDTNPGENKVKFCLFKVPFTEVLNSKTFAKLNEIQGTQDTDWGQIIAMPQAAIGSNSERDILDEKLSALQNRWGMQFLKYYGPILQVLNDDAIRKKFVPLERLSVLKRGFTSGANDFFYLDEEMALVYEIEDNFLIPLLKSPRGLKKIELDSSLKTGNYVFFCRDSKQILEGTHALEYIKEYGEKTEVTIKGIKVVGFHNTETCRARDPWYALPPHEPAPIVIQKGFSETFLVYRNSAGILVDQTFYEISPKKPISTENLLAVMNSTLGIFELLRISTSGLGGGLYRPTVNELRTLSLPDITLIPSIVIPDTMMRRKIGTIFEECGLDPHRELSTQVPRPMSDRRLLDETIFAYLGIGLEWLPELYRTVCRLVRDRLQKAERL